MPIQPITFGQPDPAHVLNPGILQNQSNDCAVKCQQLILKEFGIPIDEQTLISEATEHGWFQDGTPMEDIGKLLNLHGVETTTFHHANQYSLIQELVSGHQVIVGIDSGELWKPGFFEKLQDALGISGPDHAVIISGIDASNPNDVRVVITDPGTGRIASYSYEEFADAWEDSDFHMVCTNSAPDSYIPMEHQRAEQLLQTLDQQMDEAEQLLHHQPVLGVARHPAEAVVEAYTSLAGEIATAINSAFHSEPTGAEQAFAQDALTEGDHASASDVDGNDSAFSFSDVF